VAIALGTDVRRGLSSTEAKARLGQSGRNELAPEPKTPAWRRFLAQFQDVLVILLLIATAISAALWAYQRDTALPYEALAIFAIVGLNATMGYLQESRAEEAVAALRAMAPDQAAVIRDGEQRRVPAADLVPGDIVLLEEGNTIPADARLFESTALQTGEAALTGESLPIPKNPAPIEQDVALGDRSNMVWSGTAVTYGRGKAIVTATGPGTEMGRIVGLLEKTPAEATPLQRELDRTGKLLGLIVTVIAVIMVATIFLLGDVLTFGAAVDALILGVALAVAAVPEGLPAIVTVVLSIGVQRMARRNVIVRNLAAVEALGSASVIASDKTGTLTKNEMTVRVAVTASGRVSFGGTGYAPEGEVRNEAGGPIEGALRSELEAALAAADRANNAAVVERDGTWTVTGDPTEGALLVAARKAGLRSETLDAQLPRVGEVPFSSERKLMSTLHRASGDDRLIVFTKGAPGVLLPRCSHEQVGDAKRPLTADRRAEIDRVNESLADQALRTLGVATHWLPDEVAHDPDSGRVDPRVEQDLVFAGLIGMIDPPRPEARPAVERARRAGIRPLVITGDHPRTGAVIARELGITADGRAVTGTELERMTDDALAGTLAEVSVYARVNPEHKLRIVTALRQAGAIVAMTGDGVNDAPALKAADIGVSMGITGTDVSKKAADIVLVDDNFASIVAAVEEGRGIFANIRKFLRFLLSSNIGEVLTMFFGVVLAEQLGLPAEAGGVVLPLLATQILWINLVTDGAPALALGMDPADEGVMRQRPRSRGERVITGRMWRGIVFVGSIMAIGTLLVLDGALPGGLIEGGGDLRYGRTLAFTTLMLFQLFNVLNARSDERSGLTDLFTNRWLWGAIGLSLALQVLVLYLPPLQHAFGTVALSGWDWLHCVAVASTVLWFREIEKVVIRARRTGSATRTAAAAGP
jgi:Ca2+-transporting ATPase